MELYLNSLDFKFSFIGLSETWLDDNKEEFYDLMVIPVSIDIEKNKKGGGVSLHIQNGIPFILRNDLDYFDSELETVFIEIDKFIFNADSNIVIGIIYRMPNSSVDVFNDRIAVIMNVIQKVRKLCYLMGGLNIDFLKAGDHRATGELLDVLYCTNVFPLITKLTRVTHMTATLIDHILTNNFDDDMMHTWSETYFRQDLFPSYLFSRRQCHAIVIFRLRSISYLDSGSLPRFFGEFIYMKFKIVVS